MNRLVAAFVAAPLVAVASLVVAGCAPRSNRAHLGPTAWSSAQWRAYCAGVRTSYNPDHDLTDDTLTLVPGDPRWLDFVYWAIDNKLPEHQVEAYGGTGWKGPKGGVIFHWAPGSHWERDTRVSFGFAIGHTIGEHRWLDTMFPDFFERWGGVYGVNVKDRLAEIDPGSAAPWIAFLDYGGGQNSAYYRYLFHREAHVDPDAQTIDFIAGQGVAFTYSFPRYYHELREVATDCRIVDFFRMYDRFGPGFAATGNWAHQYPAPATVFDRIAQHHDGAAGAGAGVAGPRYDPSPPPVDVPADLPEAEAMRRGQRVYLRECGVCHGVRGDGAGFLAGDFDVKPRDFRTAMYKLRTTGPGELPTMADLERSVGDGINGTSMPAWRQFLTADEIRDVARYLVVFSPAFVEAWRARRMPTPFVVPTPPANLSTLAMHGAEVARRVACAQCHGADGKGHGPSAAALHDDAGHPAPPADLTYRWSFKNGDRPEDVYRTIVAGFNGTPMPSYAAALPDVGERWAVVAWVLSLSPAERPKLRLADYPAQRGRIDAVGHVLPAGAAK